jgi:hypothetical protein
LYCIILDIYAQIDLLLTNSAATRGVSPSFSLFLPPFQNPKRLRRELMDKEWLQEATQARQVVASSTSTSTR